MVPKSQHRKTLEPRTPNIKVRGTHTSGRQSVADIQTIYCTIIIAVIIRETKM